MKSLQSFFLLVILTGLSSCQIKENKSVSLPNILILYADDMGYGDLACQNPESRIPTPNLDRLAGEGMQFTDAHSSSGICTPSRYALLTGRYHWRKMHGIVQVFGPPVFDEERLTMAKMLKAKGYETACIGKWHLGWNWDEIRVPGSEAEQTTLNGRKQPVFHPEAFDWTMAIPGGPVDQGFNYYFGDDVINFPPYAWIENDRILEAPTTLYSRGREDTPEGSWECRPGPTVEGWDYYQVLPTLTEKAVEYLGSVDDRDHPFFLYMAFPSPHAPIIPNEEFRGKSGAGAYGDFVFQTDWCVGQILEALSEHGLEENTLVIFTSDNGPEHYAYPRVKNFNHFSMGELRGVKRDVWEGGHRVPFILRWPGKVKAGTSTETTISQVDLMATFAEVSGFALEAGEAEDSYSLLPLLDEFGERPYEREITVQNTRDGIYAVRKGDWLLIDHRTGNMNRPVLEYFDSIRGYEEHDLPGELYKLDTDIAQRMNVYASFPEVVTELKTALEEVKGEGFKEPEN